MVIIGGGRLGAAIARGFAKKGLPRDKLIITQRNPIKRQALQEEGFRVFSDISDYSDVDIVIISVKPKDLIQVLKTIKNMVSKSTVIISAVSGIRSKTLENILGNEYPLFRIKFSVFIEIEQSVIPISVCNSQAAEKLNFIESLFKLFGTIHIVPEPTMELSAWELSSLPGVIIPKILKARLDQVALEEEKKLVEQLIVSGLKSLLQYVEQQKSEKSLSQILDDLWQRIATPGGYNDAAINFLDQRGFWRLPTEAREIYKKRVEETNLEL
jgi:pyrroline-5-carboxylate reductase